MSRSGVAGLAIAIFATLTLLVVGLGMAQMASATEETDAEISEAQQKIESSSQAYEEAKARTDELQQQIDESEQRISELRGDIPEQQERSKTALRELYVMERDGASLVDMILSAESFSDLLTSIDYLGHIHSQHIDTLNSLMTSKNELEATKDTLTQACQDAQAEAERAQEALAEAQAAREEAQAKAEREAQAEREAAARAVQQAVESGKAAPAAESSSQSDGSYNVVTPEGSVGTVEPPKAENVDWGSDKTNFVNEWGARIDAYLAGSPLAGYGKVFAEAAWDYGVDPRWSPAISCIESGKGANCYRPHNAWGWGGISYGSWEEAIRAHVSGLARGYGYTISEAAAKKYCPPTWNDWYNKVSAQMSMI